MHPVEDAFAPLVGVPSWLVRKGHGSFVTLEFGQAEVAIGEPRMSRLSIDGSPPEAIRRSARVQGQWHLWIYCCCWSLSLDTTQLAHNESDDVTIERALHLLNGQAITAVTVSPADGSNEVHLRSRLRDDDDTRTGARLQFHDRRAMDALPAFR